MATGPNTDDRIVLIVGDSRFLTRELDDEIRRKTAMVPHVCRTCIEADAFLERAADRVFVAIVSLHLSDGPDCEIVDLCRNRGVSCIVFTADMDEDTRRSVFAKEIIDYVVKDANAVDALVDYVVRLDRNRGLRILLVDDSNLLTGTMAELLRRHMYQVETAGDAEAGLALLEGGSDFALVVVDHYLPGMNGLEMVRIMRESHPKDELGIIGISVSDAPGLSVRFIKGGANDYIAKPFEMEEFLCRVINNVETVVNQRNLREAKTVMNRFLGMASHDLRTPINSVRGFTDLLLEGSYGDLNPDQTEALEFIRLANGHMRNLVVDLLDMSVFEAGELRLIRKPADLCALVELRLRIHALEARKKRIALTADCADVPDFAFDERRITQVVDNLLSNALKFTPEGGEVRVAVTTADGLVRVCVRDTGQGVPPDEEDLLFQSFGKTSVRPTAGESGTGLGLPIVKTIVEEHGGLVWVESEYGHGATFCFTLPMGGAA